MTLRKRAQWAFAASLAIVMIGTLSGQLPAQAVPRSALPRAKTVASVSGADQVLNAKAPDQANDARSNVVADPGRTVRWPAPGTTEVDLAKPATSGAIRVGAPAGRVASNGKARVEVLERSKSAGRVLALRVGRVDGSGPVPLTVSYSDFADAYGGGWAQRLRLVRLPECALTTPDAVGCQQRDLASSNDLSARTVSAEVDAAPGQAATLVALAAAPSSDGGSFAATPLQATSSWESGNQSGDFSWTYPLRVPPAPGSVAPEISVSYSSQSLDGRTAASNSQASWIGDGFDWQPGSIERSYKACVDDGKTGVGDLCWGTDNAILSLPGHSGELIQISTNPDKWKLSQDDGTVIERRTDTVNGDDNHEYWKVTTVDGIRYFFGRNRLPGAGTTETKSTFTVPVYGNNTDEPCNSITWCRQAYRWNLDYVVDTRGNTTSLWYKQETNNYARNVTDTAVSSYERGGYLDHIDYGTHLDASGNDNLFTTSAPYRVAFGVVDRCVTPGSTCTSSTPSNWPDVPWDQQCTSTTNCAGHYTPVFFNQKRLSTVTTQVWKSTSYSNVEQWSFNQVFKDPGDGHEKTLWLASIGHTGLNNGQNTTTPAVTFSSVQLQNRVDRSPTKNPIIRFRIASITTDAGAVTSVNYLPAECVLGSVMPASADNNTKRCYPVYWTPYGTSSAIFDWFHKYVVGSVVVRDPVGGAPDETYTFTYTSTGPMWHYDVSELVKPVHKSWGMWRGYSMVRVVHGAAGGSQQQLDRIFFQGMNGDKKSSGTRSVTIPADADFGGTAIADEDWLAGMTREEIAYDGVGSTAPVLSKTLTTPWFNGPTATRTRNGVTTQAYEVNVRSTAALSKLDGGRGWRKTLSTNFFDVDDALPNAVGRIIRVDDANDTADPNDNTCTRTTYADNVGLNLRTAVAETETVAVSCATTPNRATDIISDTRTWYDTATSFDKTVSKGNPTRSESLKDWNNGSPIYIAESRTTFDDYGRVTDAVDALDHTTHTDYVPATGGPVTGFAVRNVKGWLTTTTVDPGYGVPTKAVDTNGRTTETTYDGLGDATAVWNPGRVRGNDSADVVISYVLRATGGPTAVSTSTLRADGNGYNVAWTLYDGLLRPRQTQTAATGGGRVVVDTKYDSTGQVVLSTAPYFNAGSPGSTLFIPSGNVPGQTVTTYDHTGRPVASIFQANGVEQWRSTKYYGGDHIDTTVPAGETATAIWSDAVGRTRKLVRYHGTAPTGAADTTQYTYWPNGKIATMKDPDGNTWQYHYDQLGRQDWTVDPDRGRSEIGYDDLNQPTTTKDNLGTVVTTAYDELGRKLSVSAGSTKLADWSYDTLVRGRVTSASSYYGTDAYTTRVDSYDIGYRPTSQTVIIPSAEGALAGSYTTTSTFNVDGSTKTVSLPAAGGLPAETLNYQYDQLGHLISLTGLTPYVTGISYDSLGRPGTQVTSDGGRALTQIWTYDDATSRLTEHGSFEDASGTVYQDNWYSYDAAGNVTAVKDLMGQYGGTDDNQCYRYDYYRRLTDAWTPSSGNCATSPAVSGLGGPAPYWQSYAYSDTTDVRTGRTDHTSTGNVTSAYAYPLAGKDRPHAVTSVTTGTRTDSYGYDGNGAMTSRAVAGKPAQTLTWDPEGRLASVSDTGGTSSYRYDGNGTRLIARTPTGNTLYLGDQEIRAVNSTLSGVRTYGGYGVRTTAGGLSWTIGDQHATNEIVLKATDLSRTQRRTTPFGEVRGANPSWPSTKGFVGGTVDPSGLTHLGAREYDPTLGRFISVDPLMSEGDPQTWDAYGYAHQNPATNSDPSGLADDFRWKRVRDYVQKIDRGFFWLYIRTEVFFKCRSDGACNGKWHDDGFHYQVLVILNFAVQFKGDTGPFAGPPHAPIADWTPKKKLHPLSPTTDEWDAFQTHLLNVHAPRKGLGENGPTLTCDPGDRLCEDQLPTYTPPSMGDFFAWASAWLGTVGPACAPCDAASTAAGILSILGYATEGNLSKAYRQTVTVILTEFVGSRMANKVSRSLIKDGARSGTAAMKQQYVNTVIATAAGAPYCGWGPSGCDEQMPGDWAYFDSDGYANFGNFFDTPGFTGQANQWRP